MVPVSEKIFIEGTPAHGEGPYIPIPIGNIRRIEVLNNENFAFVCEIINRVTLTPKYPTGIDRLNHNGTHSARQARMVEILFDVFVKGPQKTLVESLTTEEKVHLKLASYLLRSGRIDESSHTDIHPDDFCTRSAMIYEAYASQLKTSKETIAWIQKLIVNACKPIGVRDPTIDEDPKSKLCWSSLTIAHELDLIRCFEKSDIDSRIMGIVYHLLKPYTEEAITVRENLFQFSKDICVATGCYRTYDKQPGNYALFSQCSQNGGKCWEIVSNLNL